MPALLAFVVSNPNVTTAQVADSYYDVQRNLVKDVGRTGVGNDRVAAALDFPAVGADADALVTELAANLGATVEVITNIDQAVVAGAAAGAVPVPGILATSELVSVIHTSMIYTEPGIAGAAAGPVTVSGILTTDRLVKVLIAIEANPPGVNDLTDEFTITGADTIDNTGGTSSAGETLVVVYARDADLTAEFTVTDDDEIDNTGGTATTFGQLAVTWKDVS